MIRLLADQNFDERILRGLLLRNPKADVVRARDVALAEADDVDVLAPAASTSRVLVTHDVNTLVGFACQRVRAGEPMPGIVAVPQGLPIGRAIEDLLLIVECMSEEEINGQVRYLPL
jgi:predicted nuclease of predicted toxin-antitoxin system